MMQTFLPSASFTESAKWLDMKRLGKQRIEAQQILKVLMRESNDWRNHPAVKMWSGAELALAGYGAVMCIEWRNRGYKDMLLPFFEEKIAKLNKSGAKPVRPPWLGDEKFHAAHRAALMYKNPGFYVRWRWKERPALNYIWPDGLAPLPEPAPERLKPVCVVCEKPPHQGPGSMIWTTMFSRLSGKSHLVHEGCRDALMKAIERKNLSFEDRIELLAQFAPENRKAS